MSNEVRSLCVESVVQDLPQCLWSLGRSSSKDQMKRGIIMHVQPPVSQVVKQASQLSSETPALGKIRQGMFVE